MDVNPYESPQAKSNQSEFARLLIRRRRLLAAIAAMFVLLLVLGQLLIIIAVSADRSQRDYEKWHSSSQSEPAK